MVAWGGFFPALKIVAVGTEKIDMNFDMNLTSGRFAKFYLCFVALSGVATACGNSSNFAGSPKANAQGNALGRPIEGAEEGELVRKSFPREQAKGKVDVTWLLDTSGSMNNEIQIVKSNLKSFVQSLSGRTDVKVNMLADQAFLNSLGDSLGNLVTAVKMPIGSTDSLKVHVAGLKQKRVPVRADARQIIVVVSDDNAGFVHSGNYLTQVSPFLGSQNPVLYGFVATPQSKCSIARVGKEYQTLADMTGGKIYDICAVDWSDYFAQLSESVTSLVDVELQLESVPGMESEVLRVLVGDRELPAGTYEVENGKIKIKADKFKPDDNDEIVVETRKTRRKAGTR
ncbi:MAG: hypothetical protein RIQ81_352 [Pseudomonadota bacterium]|jgi:hypothetical protein